MNDIILKINDFFWGNLLIYLLMGTGIFFTIKLNFIQIREFKNGIKYIFSNFKLNGKSADKNGMSSFQAISTAIASQVGTGNLAGAATAIISGGPGAIFWMWVSAFFGMATIYSEAILAQKFRIKKNGEVIGGPAYYIESVSKNKFIGKFLAVFFAISCIISLGFTGNAVQSNSIGLAFKKAFNINPFYVGLLLAFLAFFVFSGGIKRIAYIVEKVVPIMAIVYIILASIIVILNYNNILNALLSIITSAFSTKSLLGGFLGVGVKKSMRYGIARGLFSNEAGMGSTPHAHAMAKVSNPSTQANLAMITVFIDTFIVLSLSSLVILTTNSNIENLTGIELIQSIFKYNFGYIGQSLIAILLFFFAFSTIIGWYFFGELNIKYLFKNKISIKVYQILVFIFIIIGSYQKVDLIWQLADLFNGFMVIPNLIALLLLSKKIKD